MTVEPVTEALFDENFLRRLEKLALTYRKAANSRKQGERRSLQRGQSVEFSDFRPYTLGDDFRRIDWNAYARLERLFIKLFVEEEDISLHLLIDNSLSMNWGEPNKFDFSRRAAAAIGYIALFGLDRVSASTMYTDLDRPIRHFPTVRGKNSALSLFSFISSIPIIKKPNQYPYIFAQLRGVNNHGILLLFTDLMDDGWQEQINILMNSGNEIAVIHVLSPDEEKPGFDGDFRLIDIETDGEVEITADYETLQRYKDQLMTWQANWRKFCSARQISYIPLASDIALEELLFSILPRYGVLA